MVSIYSSQGLTRASTLSYARLKPGKRVRAERKHLKKFSLMRHFVLYVLTGFYRFYVSLQRKGHSYILVSPL